MCLCVSVECDGRYAGCCFLRCNGVTVERGQQRQPCDQEKHHASPQRWAPKTKMNQAQTSTSEARA
eukprot:3238972-Amphidinium_carterae.1